MLGEVAVTDRQLKKMYSVSLKTCKQHLLNALTPLVSQILNLGPDRTIGEVGGQTSEEEEQRGGQKERERETERDIERQRERKGSETGTCH